MGHVGHVRLHAQPVRYVRFEYDHRASNVPYFTGSGGITPQGGNTARPVPRSRLYTDLVTTQNTLDMAIMVMF